MPVAEIFLSAFITVLFEKLASGALLYFARREKIHAQLKKWSQTLQVIQAVIHDAEDKQFTESGVQLWLEGLRDLAYDLDDILDEIATEALRQQLEGPYPIKSKVWNFIPTCNNLTPGVVKFNGRIMSKIKEITARLQGLAKQKSGLNLREIYQPMSHRPVVERLTTSLVNESLVYGREKDRKAILELLLKRNGCEHDVCVIPIVGMGGIGKTTLAQLVYNDKSVTKYFDLKAWVCVSEDFDVSVITKIIFESVTQSSGESKDLNFLQENLKERLSKKRFLLVLDDVWNEDYKKWDLLNLPFQVGLPGSKIIVTTRSDNIALMVGCVRAYAYHIDVLSNDDCLSLIAQHALGKRDFDSNPSFQIIGHNLAKKCKGLPLAAKTLGGLLRTKLSPQEWEDVLNSKIWDLPGESNILPVLRISYYHLPSHLKHLFAYCSIFPKDYEFNKHELVLLWTAEGFIQAVGKKTMEELGIEYFNDLLSRSFFQKLSGSNSRFVMHDLINDLAQFVAGGTCYRLDDKIEASEQYRISEKARHASFLRHEYEVLKKFKFFYNVRGLRSFVPMPIQNAHVWPPFYLSNRILLELLPKLSCLRVLSLSGYSITELPSSICNLVHLRYLNLSGSSIVCLPESIGDLNNLQTLLIRNCRYISRLPHSMQHLISLRHLDNANTDNLDEMPTSIGKLTNLQTLSKIVLGESKFGLRKLGLRELRDLVLLKGTVKILDLQNVMDVQEARNANFDQKQNLDELQMIWSNNIDDSRDQNLERNVLGMLKPHSNLKRLKIEFYGGTEFPSWIGDPLFVKLENIDLNGCIRCTSLPPLGQLRMLKHLRIGGMLGVKKIGFEFFKRGFLQGPTFPLLESLRFDCMLQWEEWSCFSELEEHEELFPCLRQLSIFKCPKLTKISPLRLPFLCEIDLQECSKVVLDSFVKLNSLTYLKVERIAGLSYLSKELIQLTEALEVLEISNCDGLRTLLEDGATLQNLPLLKRLVIADSMQFENVGGEEQQVPCNLEVLELIGCMNLKSLPVQMSSLRSLKELIIKNCPKLNAFQDIGVPPSLRRLEILRCNALDSLPAGLSRLERLEIKDCSSLRTWPNEDFPATLKKLAIKNCEYLEPVSASMFAHDGSMSLEDLSIWNWQNLSSLIGQTNQFLRLAELYISHCDYLESLPEKALQLPNLRILSIECCSNLRSLPTHVQSIASLKSLEISSCSKLEIFPRGELPPNLTTLRIWDSRKLKPLAEWGLHRLTFLKEFSICGGFPKLVSLVDDENLFPPTLEKLVIARFPKLKSLSKGISFSSLRHLSIMNCRNLLVLPGEDLLERLWHLEISDCPLLKHRCLKEKGEYWPRISGIPCVEIDGSDIYRQNSN